MKLDWEKAVQELREKSMDDIQTETAKTWASRALAAYAIASRKDGKERSEWLADATEYAAEALEHSVLAEDDDLVTDLRELLRAAKAKVEG